MRRGSFRRYLMGARSVRTFDLTLREFRHDVQRSRCRRWPLEKLSAWSAIAPEQESLRFLTCLLESCPILESDRVRLRGAQSVKAFDLALWEFRRDIQRSDWRRWPLEKLSSWSAIAPKQESLCFLACLLESRPILESDRIRLFWTRNPSLLADHFPRMERDRLCKLTEDTQK